MGIKIMHKPYRLVGTDTTGTEVWRATVNPPMLCGVNKDNKNPKNAKGQWIRVFTVIGVGNSTLAEGDEVTVYQTPGDFPEGTLDDVVLSIEVIEGIRAAKPRKAKVVADQNPTVPDGMKLKPVSVVADEATEDDKAAAEAEAIENMESEEVVTASDIVSTED